MGWDNSTSFYIYCLLFLFQTYGMTLVATFKTAIYGSLLRLCWELQCLTTFRLQIKCCPNSLFDVIIFFGAIWYHTTFSWLINALRDWCEVCVELHTHTHTQHALIEKYPFLCGKRDMHPSCAHVPVIYHRTTAKLCLQPTKFSHRKLNWPRSHCCTEFCFSVWDTKMPSALESIISHVLTTERCWMTTSCFIIKWNIHAKYVYRFSTVSVYPMIFFTEVKSSSIKATETLRKINCARYMWTNPVIVPG